MFLDTVAQQFNTQATSSWLQQLQQQALQQLQREGLPSIRDEDWKYTSLDALLSKDYISAAPMTASTPTITTPFLLNEIAGPRLVFINGHFSARYSAIDHLPTGISLQPLSVALRTKSQTLQHYLGRIAKQPTISLLPLNSALFYEGFYLQIAANTRCEVPIQICHVNTAQTHALAIYPRHLIVADSHCCVEVIEHYFSVGDSHNLICPVTETMLEAGAKLTHYHIQQEAKTAYNLASIYVQQERDSQFTSHALNLGARLSRHDINIQLVAPGGSCFLNGLYMMQGRQHHDTHTRIDHLVPHGTSREDYKGILDDFAHAVFNGKVIVHPGAMQTDAEQSNKNLLLSNEAEVDTKPQLEIFADDVKCTHGATVGQLDEEALFFLRSRGIDQATARDLLVYGFAGSVIDNIQHAHVRKILKQAVLTDLMRGTRIGEIMR